MNKKKTKRVKEPIKVRLKELVDGNKSIYLDLYMNGKREREFLKLYLIPERSSADKEANAQTLRVANAVKSQKIIELQNAAHGFSLTKTRSKVNLPDFVEHLADQKGAKNKEVHRNFIALRRHLIEYKGIKTTFDYVNKDFCLGFIEYLKDAKCVNYKDDKKLHRNTQRGYMKRLSAVFNAAIIDEILEVNPFNKIRPEHKIKGTDTNREYLTIDEIRTLDKTECPKPGIKMAFLFACLCGLRLSDMMNLTWEKFQTDNNGNVFIKFTSKKTQRIEYLPINDEAKKYLPDREGTFDHELIFRDLPSKRYLNLILQKWTAHAGIKKHITFHCSRHTYATLLLSKGVTIEVVSKLLGHKCLKTTEIYAKIVDNAKIDAVSILNGIVN